MSEIEQVPGVDASDRDRLNPRKEPEESSSQHQEPKESSSQQTKHEERNLRTIHPHRNVL
jgi:hypothetical protein